MPTGPGFTIAASVLWMVAVTTTTSSTFGVITFLRHSARVFESNGRAFFLLALILSLPLLAYDLVFPVGPGDVGIDFTAAIHSTITYTITSVLTQVTTAAVAYGAFQHLDGRAVSRGNCVSRGLSLVLPAIGVALLAGLITGIGFVLLVIPGVIAMVMLWVAIPAAVVERLGVIGSLKRSAELTRGYRWKVLGIVLIVMVIAYMSAFLFAGWLFFSPHGPVVHSIGLYVARAIYGVVTATVACVGYYYLRAAKEGVDIAEIAKVFD